MGGALAFPWNQLWVLMQIPNQKVLQTGICSKIQCLLQAGAMRRDVFISFVSLTLHVHCIKQFIKGSPFTAKSMLHRQTTLTLWWKSVCWGTAAKSVPPQEEENSATSQQIWVCSPFSLSCNTAQQLQLLRWFARLLSKSGSASGRLGLCGRLLENRVLNSHNADYQNIRNSKDYDFPNISQH